MGAVKIIGIILAVLIIAGGIGFFMLTKSGVTTAFLNVERQEVQADKGSGWQTAQDGMELKEENKVKTSETGEASLILFESAIVGIEPNSEITVGDVSKEKAHIQQTGSTWNKFTGLNGLQTLEIETPNAVVTVRGTEFGITDDEVPVLEGKVTVKIKDGGKIVEVEGGHKAIIQTSEVVELTPEEMEALRRKSKRTLKNLIEVRARLIEKNKFVIERVKSAADVDEEELRQLMQDMDEGKYDEDILLEKTPVELDALNQFVALTKQIKKQLNEN